MAREQTTPSHGLTIYLMKPQCQDVASLIQTEGLNIRELSFGAAKLGTLFVQSSSPRAPRWVRFFEGYVDARVFGQVASSAAVLVIECSGRLFAITFGHGRHLLNPESWEERFGLRVALNSLGESNIRSIDKRSFDAISRHSREQASREVTARDFGLDIEQDLLRAVTGTPIDPSLGRRLYGMDALHATVQIAIQELPRLLATYYEKYLDDFYRTAFPWVDQITEISSQALIEELENTVIRRIAEGNLDRIWMAVPEVVPWERIDGFRYGFGRHSPRYHDIHLPDFCESLRDPSNVSKKTLTQRKVYCIDNDGQTFETWQAYRCLYAEIERNNESFLLSGGKWYRITHDFVQEVNEFYRTLTRHEDEFPQYDEESETAYNERIAVSDPDRFALMDRKIVPYGGGYNRIEFCDLLSQKKEIIHVKRYGSSSVLSHLFAQGLVSGELFHTESGFRRAVNDLLPERHRIDDPEQIPRPGEYQVVFAVISDTPGNLMVPFFSRINLKHATRRLKGYGYKVTLAKIDVTEEYRALRKYD